MNPARLLPWLLPVLLAGESLAGDGFIYLNVSVKFILYPGDGLRPRQDRNNPATRITDAQINTSIADANRFLASYGRGYRLRVVETLSIGGINQDHSNQTKTKPGYYAIQSTDANSITFYYPAGYVNPRGETPATGPLIDVLDQNARSSAATKLDFKWNDYAVNVFVPSDWGGGGGISPAWGNAAGFGAFEGWLFLHELGHYYDLIHTFGEDLVADTLVDPLSVTQDGIAMEFYGIQYYGNCTAAQQAVIDTAYYSRARNSIAAANNTPPNDVLSGSVWSLLPPTEQQWVDDTFFNIMSYNDPPHRNLLVTRMTEGQANRLTDAANFSRHQTVTGYTRHVAISGADTLGGLLNSGMAAVNPVRHVAAAAARAADIPGDDEILLLRPGNYNEQLTITTPCTLRATRNGPVVVGKP